MTFDSLVNQGEYLSAYYLDEVLPDKLRSGMMRQWAEAERAKAPTPRQGLRDLSTRLLAVRSQLAEGAELYQSLPDAFAVEDLDAAARRLKQEPDLDEQPVPNWRWEPGASDEGDWRTALREWHTVLLRGLGFEPRPTVRTVRSAAGAHAVPLAHAEEGIVVLTGGFATEVDGALSAEGANRLPAPVSVGPGKRLATVTDLASWFLSAADHPPRYALLLFGGVMLLADRNAFGQGRYLAVSIDTALGRKAPKSTSVGEIDLIAALFGAPSLSPADDGAEDELSRIIAASQEHSVGVSAELREGLKESVQIIANEVLELAREDGVSAAELSEWLPGELKSPTDLPRLLTTESLRYLYRVLFLLYAEARPELHILPMKSEEYVTGYSLARLRDLVVPQQLADSHARTGHHLHESLALLFEKVYTGHPVADTARERGGPVSRASEIPEELLPDDGHPSVRIEALRSRLFDPESIKLVGQVLSVPPNGVGDGTRTRPLDLRLRNKALHQVLRRLTLVEGRSGARGGFISYAQLGINQLGAVYEGLMSYSGFIAEQPKYEVAPGGDARGGSWLITKAQAQSGRYPESVFVKEGPAHDQVSKVHEVGTFVYRLAGRERQTSASYYTPASLTKATVEQTLRFRLHPQGDPDRSKSEVTAAEVLGWRVCEPALGSGAFLNEAVDQLAELYLELAQREAGRDIPAEHRPTELQRVKAHIALHNAYGVDLNRTAVELAEISLWLNTVHPGMKAPWYGLHLHRGNSLIGAARRVYGQDVLAEGAWLRSRDPERPVAVPLTEESIPAGAVHQFLLPAWGWGAVADEAEARRLEPVAAHALRTWRASIRKKPTVPDALKAAKAATATTAKKSPRRASVSAAETSGAATRPLTVRLGEREPKQEALAGLELTVWEQDGLDFGASMPSPVRETAAPPSTTRRPRASRAAEAAAERRAAEKAARTQLARLQALAGRVEYLWSQVVRRLELSEQEIARPLDLWPRASAAGAGDGDVDGERSQGQSLLGGKVVDRDAVLQALHGSEGPYWRLKQLMDAWCALWFWPVEEAGLLDGSDPVYRGADGTNLTDLPRGVPGRKTALRGLDDWIEFAEALVGAVDVDRDGNSLIGVVEAEDLEQLDSFETHLNEVMINNGFWTSAFDLGDRFPWYGTVRRIAEQRGFFHWELDFAHIFRQGGFDLQVGNPPWVKQEWKEGGVLAEFEPWFELADRPSTKEWAKLKAEVLERSDARSAFLGELADNAAMASFFASPDTYPELVGTQPDLYRAFMLVSWRCIGERGISGLLHPSTHFTGAKEKKLRRAAYGHLRLHADFVNAKLLFAPPVSDTTHFSLNVYGQARDIEFQHINWLFHPLTLSLSVNHDGKGNLPGIKHNGKWDTRPHRRRITTVTPSTLASWRKLAGEEEPPPLEETKLLFPVTDAEEEAIAALAAWPYRLGGLEPRISRGFDEKNDRTRGYFTWKSGEAKTWSDVILQGPFFGIATPFAKRPIEGAQTSLQMEQWDAATLSPDAIPRTNYRRACELDDFMAAQDRWVDFTELDRLRMDPEALAEAAKIVDSAKRTLSPEDREKAIQSALEDMAKRPYSQFHRLAWRRMIPSNTERSLFAALVPNGPAHINAVHTLAASQPRETAIAAGFWSSLPMDYLLRITGRTDLQIGDAPRMPMGHASHPLAGSLLLRTLRLNCQTNAYSSLWNELFDPAWKLDTWAGDWAGLQALASDIGPEWTVATPLRTERARRAALVELDALVAVWLGISADQLLAMYNARYPVLQQYEANMWFDDSGRRIAKAHQVHGYGQPREAWVQLSSHPEFPEEGQLPTPPEHAAHSDPAENWAYADPVRRAKREEEMALAHERFTQRMRDAGWKPGMSVPPDTVADSTSPTAEKAEKQEDVTTS